MRGVGVKYTTISCSTFSWWVVEANDKKRARLNCIAHLLTRIPYQEVPYEKPILPKRAHSPDYHRTPVPKEMYVPDHYANLTNAKSLRGPQRFRGGEGSEPAGRALRGAVRW